MIVIRGIKDATAKNIKRALLDAEADPQNNMQNTFQPVRWTTDKQRRLIVQIAMMIHGREGGVASGLSFTDPR